MKQAAASFAAATALTLTFSVCGIAAGRDTHAAAEPHGTEAHGSQDHGYPTAREGAVKEAHGTAHGQQGEEAIPGTAGDVGFGDMGSGATRPGNAGGGTRTTNYNTIGSASYGRLPAFALHQDFPTTGGAPSVKTVAFATAPGLAVPGFGGDQHQTSGTQPQTTGTATGGADLLPAAFAPIPQGAKGTFVRDHAMPASVNSPTVGGYFNPRSVPSQDVGVLIPSYFANPEKRELPVEVPHKDADDVTKIDTKDTH